MHTFLPKLKVFTAITILGLSMGACEALSKRDKGLIVDFEVDLNLAQDQSIATNEADTTPFLLSEMLPKDLATGLLTGALHGADWRLNDKGLPKNARQVAEGYWIGARPSVDEIAELYAHDVRLILTGASIKSAEFKRLKKRMDSLGISHINVPFGGRFPKPSRFEKGLQHYTPEQIYIHCEHGGDRSGALLAYLLVTRHNWSTTRALLAVAFPGKNDTRALIDILQSRGHEVSENDIEEVLGIYSAEYNGGFGGLKVRSRGYVRLVNTTIDAIGRSLN